MMRTVSMGVKVVAGRWSPGDGAMFICCGEAEFMMLCDLLRLWLNVFSSVASIWVWLNLLQWLSWLSLGLLQSVTTPFWVCMVNQLMGHFVAVKQQLIVISASLKASFTCLLHLLLCQLERFSITLHLWFKLLLSVLFKIKESNSLSFPLQNTSQCFLEIDSFNAKASLPPANVWVYLLHKFSQLPKKSITCHCPHLLLWSY